MKKTVLLISIVLLSCKQNKEVEKLAKEGSTQVKSGNDSVITIKYEIGNGLESKVSIAAFHKNLNDISLAAKGRCKFPLTYKPTFYSIVGKGDTLYSSIDYIASNAFNVPKKNEQIMVMLLNKDSSLTEINTTH